MPPVMETIIVYHWKSGAYVNSFSLDFDELYRELVEQYGPPAIAIINS